MAHYSIKDLEKVTGIKAHTIRIWEKRYEIVEPSRSDTNIRSYSDDDLRKLLNISLLNRNGIKISRLAKMSLEEINEQVSNLSRIPEDSDAKIESLLLAMIDLDEMRFQNTLYYAIEKMGFECAFIKVVAPFMAKAGVLWMSGTINPAQEHFVSNLIRQKLIAEIDRMGPAPSGKASRFLLFLPEGELHELGLLFMTYLVRKNGHEVLYFGQSTPLGSAVEAAQSWKPDFIGLSLVNGLVYAELEDFLHELKQAFPDLPILLQGYQTQFIDPESFPGFHIVNDFEAFTSWLANL